MSLPGKKVCCYKKLYNKTELCKTLLQRRFNPYLDSFDQSVSWYVSVELGTIQ